MALAILGVTAIEVAAVASGSKTRPSSHRRIRQQLHGSQGLFTRHRYRPSLKITGFRRDGKTAEITCEFSTRAGFLDRIEVRSGLKILTTVKPGKPVSSGAVKLKVDLSKAGSGNHSIKLWGWQGRRGYQSVHGESKAIKIAN